MTPRVSKRVATVAQKAITGTGEHRITEWAFALLGVALLAADGYFLRQHPPSGTGDHVFHGFWGLVAIAFIPGAASRAASGISKIAGAAAAAWKAKQ